MTFRFFNLHPQDKSLATAVAQPAHNPPLRLKSCWRMAPSGCLECVWYMAPD